MRRLLRPLLPLVRPFAREWRRYRLAGRLTRWPRQLIVGAGEVSYANWAATDRDVLDITKDADWRDLCPPGTLDAILAEHVWEHLSEEEALTAARLCFNYLRPGGNLRVAVPDGLHPDPAYLTYVSPPAQGHRTLYTFRTLAGLFQAAGFEVEPLEWFDESGKFHGMNWDAALGIIQRSARFEQRCTPLGIHYSSIILDARKMAA